MSLTIQMAAQVRIPLGALICLVSVVCCQVEVCAKSWSLVHRSLNESGVYECDHKASKWGGPGPLRPVAPWKTQHNLPSNCNIHLLYNAVHNFWTNSKTHLKKYNGLHICLRAQITHTHTQIHKNTGSHIRLCLCIFPTRMGQQPLVDQGLLIIEASRSHSDTLHSVGLLWASDRSDEETSNWQHTTFTRVRGTHTPDGIRNCNPNKRGAEVLHLRPREHWNLLHKYKQTNK